jgi:hypothetical protein
MDNGPTATVFARHALEALAAVLQFLVRTAKMATRMMPLMTARNVLGDDFLMAWKKRLQAGSTSVTHVLEQFAADARPNARHAKVDCKILGIRIVMTARNVPLEHIPISPWKRVRNAMEMFAADVMQQVA